ncbi:MAG: hypothetical protein IJ812_01270 [Schwartzia sp.]|nr:hypothetical protein [Schwartzia sp. (in: firmicutes)]
MKEGWQKLSFREASPCEARAREEGLPTGKCGTHREGNGAQKRLVILGAGREAMEAPCFALRRWSFAKLPSANTSSFPVAFVFFRKEGAEAGPVRNLKERWGVGTESVTVDFIGVFARAESLLQTEF